MLEADLGLQWVIEVDILPIASESYCPDWDPVYLSQIVPLASSLIQIPGCCKQGIRCSMSVPQYHCSDHHQDKSQDSDQRTLQSRWATAVDEHVMANVCDCVRLFRKTAQRHSSVVVSNSWVVMRCEPWRRVHMHYISFYHLRTDAIMVL